MTYMLLNLLALEYMHQSDDNNKNKKKNITNLQLKIVIPGREKLRGIIPKCIIMQCIPARNHFKMLRKKKMLMEKILPMHTLQGIIRKTTNKTNSM